MLATNSLPETGHGGSMWFPGQDKLWSATATASVVASARTEQLTQAHQEMLGLLADLPESEHKLSFSDLVVVHADQDKATGDVVLDPEVESSDGSKRRPAADHDRNGRQEPAAFDKEAKDGDLGASKRSRSRRGGGTSGSEQPVLLKPNRIGSGGNIVGEGVLLNLYMPSSLTRSLTAGSLSRSSRYSSATERPAASTATFSGEAQMAKFGCWSSIWATKGKHNTRGNSLSITGEKGKNNNGHDKKKKKVQSARRASSEALV